MSESKMPLTGGADGTAEPADQLEGLLAFYAARRLDPRYGAMPRIRAAIFQQAEAGSPLFVDRAAAWRARVARRLVTAGLAASLSLAAAATVVTAGPASPFYGARLWVEALTLPAAAGDRSEAHRQRLETRLDEVEAAAASGNGAAIAQALAAYRAEVEAALSDVGDDAERLARLEAALGTHLVVLDALADRVPSQALDAIERAMSASNRAVEKIKEKKDKVRPSRPPSTPRPNR